VRRGRKHTNPFKIGRVEHLVAQQYDMEVNEIKKVVWENLATIIQ
jgi:hypothetical protein